MLQPGSRVVELIGYLAAVLTTAAFVPQVLHTWRSKAAGGLSLGMLTAFIAGITLWLVYGIALRSAPVIAANATTLALNILLVVMRLRYHSHTGSRRQGARDERMS